MTIGWFDGSCEPNPGQMGIGAIIRDSEGTLIDSLSERRGNGTSNVAEWMALIALLEMARRNGIEELEVRGDSQLVINQVTQKWRVNSEHLLPYRAKALGIAREFKSITYKWVRRSENEEADALSNGR